MKNKIIKVGLIGKTNAGKSTLINAIVGEEISIVNKKINTTLDSIIGIKNINNTQIIFYDTPGLNFLKTKDLSQKQLRKNLWNAIDNVDLIVYLIDASKYNYNNAINDVNNFQDLEKKIILVFNKIDLIEKNSKILPHIDELQKNTKLKDFFNISAKYSRGTDALIKYIIAQSYNQSWIFKNDEITNKDEIYISNESTRNAILKLIHKEIPYNLKVKNLVFKYLVNKDLKIKQSIQISNSRYKSIILGKKGEKIKAIREMSQQNIKNILQCNVHLYLKVELQNEK